MNGLLLGILFFWIWIGGTMLSMAKTREMYKELPHIQQAKFEDPATGGLAIEFIAHFMAWPFLLMYNPRNKK